MIRLRLLHFIASFVVIFSFTASAQVIKDYPTTGFSNTPHIETFDKKFIDFLRQWGLPGGQVTVMKNGNILVKRGYGWANMITRQPIEPYSQFRIASVSKTITAIAILKLVDENKLNLNDKVFHILNDLKPLKNRKINPKIYQISILNLLQMSSGWFAPGSHFDPLFGPWPQPIVRILSPELPASCQTTTRYMMSAPLRFKPGTSYSYSNLDYCILGLVINKVTGSPYGYQGYENFIRSSLLAPLQIKDMAIASTQYKYRLPHEVTYYRDIHATHQMLDDKADLPYSTSEILKKNFANGGWVATATDLAVLIQAALEHKILSQKSLDLMLSKPSFVNPKRSSYYTIGSLIDVRQGKRYWVQHGSFTGTHSLIVTKPDGTTITALFNSRPNASFFSRCRPQLLNLLINSEF